MSRIPYTAGNYTHWTSNTVIFTRAREDHGVLAVRHGQTFGGTSAYALLGPDLYMPGGSTNNSPTATGPGWDQPWPHANAGGPNLCFTQDAAQSWKRAHLINAEWGGSGSNWRNLVPMTATGNSNHKTVEARMKVYLQNFRAFEENGRHDFWYCLQYWVQASLDPWAAPPAATGNLYSYAPNMIKVTWRIMKLDKFPGGALPNSAAALPLARQQIATGPLTPASDADIQFDLPNMPATPLPPVLVNNQANRQAMGGFVYPIPPNAPAIPAANSAFDGEVEVMQD
jgi:hypothetical protein